MRQLGVHQCDCGCESEVEGGIPSSEAAGCAPVRLLGVHQCDGWLSLNRRWNSKLGGSWVCTSAAPGCLGVGASGLILNYVIV